jgi:formylglycine-generating enzyme required for sulfatase activity
VESQSRLRPFAIRFAFFVLGIVALGDASDHVASGQGRARRPVHYGQMVPIPAGTFSMGSAEGVGREDERPARSVALHAFEMDRVEVTVAAYSRCVSAGGCDAPQPEWEACNWRKDGRAGHPINCVKWEDARRFCAWADKRLPTEAEWEYAARGTDGRTFPWGNAAPTDARLWWRQEGTAPVGSRPRGASPFGVLDMAGNVREWTADWYGPYEGGAVPNPAWRAVRGGDFIRREAEDVRAARRYTFGPDRADTPLGFRCAR